MQRREEIRFKRPDFFYACIWFALYLIELFIPDNTTQYHKKCNNKKDVNNRAEIIKEETNDPEERQDHRNNLVSVGHCILHKEQR